MNEKDLIADIICDEQLTDEDLDDIIKKINEIKSERKTKDN